MFDYAGWNFIGAVGRMLQMQGSAVLINKYFGPSVNAGFSLANTINNHCQSLVSSLRTAFIPARKVTRTEEPRGSQSEKSRR